MWSLFCVLLCYFLRHNKIFIGCVQQQMEQSCAWFFARKHVLYCVSILSCFFSSGDGCKRLLKIVPSPTLPCNIDLHYGATLVSCGVAECGSHTKQAAFGSRSTHFCIFFQCKILIFSCGSRDMRITDTVCYRYQSIFFFLKRKKLIKQEEQKDMCGHKMQKRVKCAWEKFLGFQLESYHVWWNKFIDVIAYRVILVLTSVSIKSINKMINLMWQWFTWGNKLN